MKKLLMTLSFIATATLAMAVPAQRGIWKTVRLADGREVRVELKGDEFGHYWQAADGTGYVKKQGTEVYEIANKTMIAEKAMELRKEANTKRMLAKAGQGQMKATIGGDHPAYTGTKKGLIILVEFADTKFKPGHDQALYDRIANEEGFTSNDGFVGSVKDYFRDQSEGQFTLDFDVVGPMTMPKGYAYYGANGYNGAIDLNVRSMVVEACQQADSQVNFADYDWDGDGAVDQVFILYAGRGEATGGDENTIWPHESQLGYGIKLDGVVINTYACSNEMRSDTQPEGIGVICHEFSHCMGLPDMYDTQYGGNFGMGVWDIMDSGSHLDNGFTPPSYTSYERMYCGWKQPIEITGDTVITDMKAIGEGGDTYIMYNQGNKNEYYLFENRQQTGWDSELYGSGLLVLHVDFNKSVWSYNMVNCTTNAYINDHQRCTIIHADNKDGSTSAADFAGDPFPYGSVNCITATTTPSTMLYNKNTDGTYYMDKSILNIARHNNGTVSFEVKKNENQDINKPDEAIFYESFSMCSGVGGNDNIWSGENVGNNSFIPDNTGWTTTVMAGADKCALFGNSSRNGEVTTPEFEIDGETTLMFKAAPWTGDGTTIVLSVSGGNAKKEKTSFRLEQNQWNDCNTIITGSGKIKLTFRSIRRRFFLDEVLVTSTDINGIEDIKTTATEYRNGHIYTIDGRYMGTDINKVGKGIYIVDGHKFVK